MDVNATLQTWINVLTHPGEATFAEEQTKPQANFTTAIIWMVITGVISGIAGWLSFTILGGAGGMMAMVDQMNLPPEVAEQMRQMFASGVMGGAGFSAIITTPLFFFIGAAIFYLIGRMLGGSGDLGRYSYLLASFQAPIGILSALLNLVPMLGACISAILAIYSLVLTYFATKVGLNLSSGKAIAVILIPVILFFLLIFCFAFAIAGLFMSIQNQ
ncbi:MAG: YIP1 family protein [Caldilinea sp. CFX5]|nr:YIP1 family protein [Caldilinea sp. CFX5]